MYSFFKKNLALYLTTIDSNGTDFRSKISLVFFALIDKATYDAWRLQDPNKYIEASNLIYQIGRNTDNNPLFETLAWDFWACDFEAAESKNYDAEVLEEQLKIINLCVRGQYL